MAGAGRRGDWKLIWRETGLWRGWYPPSELQLGAGPADTPGWAGRGAGQGYRLVQSLGKRVWQAWLPLDNQTQDLLFHLGSLTAWKLGLMWLQGAGPGIPGSLSIRCCEVRPRPGPGGDDQPGGHPPGRGEGVAGPPAGAGRHPAQPRPHRGEQEGGLAPGRSLGHRLVLTRSTVIVKTSFQASSSQQFSFECPIVIKKEKYVERIWPAVLTVPPPPTIRLPVYELRADRVTWPCRTVSQNTMARH